jgi:lipopolysaccharide/colanic/teichoic acid biosynthesis glycosyltransferase
MSTRSNMLLEIFSRLVAFVFIVGFSPIFIIISLFSILFQGLPVFFKQERVGHNFKIFKIYKFRSMVHNSGKSITDPNDLRITKFGKFLRKTKLDEIPQLINIIKGEMRFIGPRPEVENYFSKQKFKFLKNVKPGISDFASIILRNESKILDQIGGEEPYEKLLPIKIELAQYYSLKKSFMLDLQLVIITVISIFFSRFATRSLANPLIKIKTLETEAFINSYILD